MLKISDLAKRRNEWIFEGGQYTLLDAEDCMVRISRVYPSSTASAKWGFAWAHLDSPFGIPSPGMTLYDSAEEAMAMLTATFVEHFAWFEAA